MRILPRRGWPDEARLIAQLPTFQSLTREAPLAGRCLNAGCGEGLYCPFIEQFQEVTAVVNVDLAGTRSTLAKLSDSRHSALDASLTDLPFPDRYFDSCLCTEVLEHIPDDELAVQELGRCVKPGGRLLVSVPHVPAPFDPAHVREGYTLSGLTALLQRNGFVIVKSGMCMSGWMKWLLQIWRWQHRVIGGGHRNFMPRTVVRAFGYADTLLPIGCRWDLVAAAVHQ